MRKLMQQIGSLGQSKARADQETQLVAHKSWKKLKKKKFVENDGRKWRRDEK